MVASSADINTQMGAILGTAPRGSGTITAPGSEIDIKGGVDPLDLGSLTLGGKKKKEDQPFLKAAPFQLSSEIIDLLENANFNTANQQSVLEDVTNVATANDTFGEVGVQPTILDTLNDNSDNQLFDNVALGTDLDVRRQTDALGLSTDAGVDVLTPSLGAEDILFSEIPDVNVTRRPTSDELRVSSIAAGGALQALTTNQSNADIAKNVGISLLASNNPILDTAIQGKSVLDGAVKTFTGDGATISRQLGVGLDVLSLANKITGIATSFDSVGDAIEQTVQGIESTVDGITRVVTDPRAVADEARNLFVYGTGDPVVTNVPLAHGTHRYTTDSQGNLVTTPGWLSALMFMVPKPVSPAFGAAGTLSQVAGSGEGGSLYAMGKGLAAKTLGNITGIEPPTDEAGNILPSYIESLENNYKDFTNAALPGGLELTDNVTVYQNAGSGSTYLNYALDPTGPTGAFGNVINIDKLPPDVPFEKLTAFDIRPALLDLNDYVYSGEDTDKFATGINKVEASTAERVSKITEVRDHVRDVTGIYATNSTELKEAMAGKYGDAFNKLDKAREDALNTFMESWTLGGDEYLTDLGPDSKAVVGFKNTFAIEQYKKNPRNIARQQASADEFNTISQDTVGLNYNSPEAGFLDPETRSEVAIGNTVMGMTGQSTFGYGKTDLAVIDSFYDRAGKDENGQANASKASFVNSAEGQQMLETITLEEMGKEKAEVQTKSSEQLASLTAGPRFDENKGWVDQYGNPTADPSKSAQDRQALTVKASGPVPAGNWFYGPLGLVEGFVRGVTGDLTKAVTDATRTKPTFDAPADDDQEEASSKAGGLVAQSVVDDTYGLGGLTEDADWDADATGGWW